jgi:hypothetical protein
MKLLLENWQEFLKESPNRDHPAASADYLFTHPALSIIRKSIRDKEDLNKLRDKLDMDTGQFSELITIISNEPEFDDDDELLDFIMGTFKRTKNETIN